MEKHAVIIPTYNEQENIAQLVEEILALGLGSQIIIVDDNSPDGTGQIADELAAMDANVQVIHRSGKLGLGTAHIAGIKAALENGSSYILTMDADFSHHPRHIPAMLAASCMLTIASALLASAMDCLRFSETSFIADRASDSE